MRQPRRLQPSGHSHWSGNGFHWNHANYRLNRLENCCGAHNSNICVPGQYNPKASLCGHTLMASYGNAEDRNILMENLKNLLDLSLRLPLEGEITPIMAWVIIATHERFTELTLADFEVLGDDLQRVTRCYGCVPDFRFVASILDPVSTTTDQS